MSSIVQSHGNSEFTLASTAIALGCGKIVDFFTHSQPLIENISYMVAAAAGLITIYYKFKRKG